MPKRKAINGFAREFSWELHQTYKRLGVVRVLRRLPGFLPKSLFPIQTLAIPHIVSGQDAVVRASPRSGKTLAYFIGLAEIFYILGSERTGPFAMIILPTIRSCVKVFNRFNQLCSPDIKASLIERAVPLPEWSNGYPDVVVATPDCALAYSVHHESPWVLVFDEVDSLLSLGFESQLKSLRDRVSKSCQCLVFSADPSADVKNLKNFVRHNPYVLTLTADGRLVAELSPYNLKHFYIPSKEGDKFSWLLYYLKYRPVYSKVLVFTNSDETSSELQRFIQKSNSGIEYTSSVLSSGWIQEPPALKDFNTVDSGLLIVTDYTPPAPNQTRRGKKKAKKHSEQELDLESAVYKKVDIVVHFDMPKNASGYVRRILCTTRRASHIGESVSLACPSDKDVHKEIKALLPSDDNLNTNVLVGLPRFSWLTDDEGVEDPLSYEEIIKSLYD